jgi:hypothetical protein
MTPLEALGIAFVSGTVAALVTAWATVHVEALRHVYEDRARFIDLRRQRYSDLLRESDEHVRTIRRQHGAVVEYLVEHGRTTVDAPTLGSTDPLEPPGGRDLSARAHARGRGRCGRSL